MWIVSQILAHQCAPNAVITDTCVSWSPKNQGVRKYPFSHFVRTSNSHVCLFLDQLDHVLGLPAFSLHSLCTVYVPAKYRR